MFQDLLDFFFYRYLCFFSLSPLLSHSSFLFMWIVGIVLINFLFVSELIKKNKKNLQFVSELNQWLFFYYGTSCLDDSVSH